MSDDLRALVDRLKQAEAEGQPTNGTWLVAELDRLLTPEPAPEVDAAWDELVDELDHLFYPYLTVKQNQADIAFKFQALLHNPGTGHKLTVEQLSLRNEYFNNLKALKWEKES